MLYLCCKYTTSFSSFDLLSSFISLLESEGVVVFFHRRAIPKKVLGVAVSISFSIMAVIAVGLRPLARYLAGKKMDAE
ncbi:hypothetical protein PDIG_26400 [Penicillium digitatum PHI26]|uniref:Uncharacterized protein n=1 Tax=Penicillium digitatum (strain PHI26 / CECT 20796) TaxID=1170229 RepID=K9G384_PEND2|nr:hypothetical protein PDIG_26400 [Penicillium digitatum PHI26]